MFKLALQRRIKWPVVVRVPVDGGKVREERFTAEFEVLKKSELTAVEGDILERVFIGFDEVVSTENQPLPFDPKNKAEMLDLTFVRHALFEAHTEVQTGQAARKN